MDAFPKKGSGYKAFSVFQILTVKNKCMADSVSFEIWNDFLYPVTLKPFDQLLFSCIERVWFFCVALGDLIN